MKESKSMKVAGTRKTLDTVEAPARNNASMVIPVIEETVDVRKREVEAGVVRITKVVHKEEAVIDEPLLREEVEVKHVPINRFLDSPVAVRYEGDTMILPVVEEVIEKRLMLREELHITKRQVKVVEPQQVTLRREEVKVERVNPPEQS